MEWTDVVDNPLLQNLPFKIELNRWGKILMSPASNNHGILQFEVGVEVISPSNSKAEMAEKIQLTLNQGAKEVWLVDQQGQITYFSNDGQIETSKETEPRAF